MGTYHELTQCRLCDGPLDKVLDLGASPLANALHIGGTQCGPDGHGRFPVAWDTPDEDDPQPDDAKCPLYLSRCLTCGHVQLPVVVDPKLLFPDEYPYRSATSPVFRAHLDAFARDVHSGARSVLEIGSNDGYLLSRFRELGCRTIGVDPALNLAREATGAGHLTLPYFFDEKTAATILHSFGPVDLIVANNVMAHIENLRSVFRGVRLLLADGGRFVFEVGWLADVVRTNNFPVVYHEHLSVHSLGPLARLCEAEGLVLYKAERVDTQGGSLRCFVCLPGQSTFDLDGWLPLAEAERNWATKEALLGWQARVDAAAGALRDKLRELKAAGATIAGYGASAKSTTLLHVAGIGRETIDFVCDANPDKIGKFTPGKHLPLVHPSELETRQPDYCVMLSGNFSRSIREQHPGYRGKWVEPLPTLEVL